MSGQDPPRLARGDALFLDFDGTLAEIGPDPDAITLPAGAAALLDGLAAALGGAVAVISGRGLADLAGRVPAGLWRIGAHGLE
ncbi:MAG: trehalose-phosphatase, partial [Alphaproteobacteria bacterium]